VPLFGRYPDKMFKYLSWLILIGLFIIAFLIPKKQSTAFANYKIINYQLENKNRRLLVADNQQKWERGLMHVATMEAGIDGMIFIFPQKDWQSFWNKNTLMDLEIYWISGDRVVGKDFLPAAKGQETLTIVSPQKVDKVIEIVK